MVRDTNFTTIFKKFLCMFALKYKLLAHISHAI